MKRLAHILTVCLTLSMFGFLAGCGDPKPSTTEPAADYVDPSTNPDANSDPDATTDGGEK